MGKVGGRAVHLAPAGAAGHQAGVGVVEAPGQYEEEGCGGEDHGVKVVVGVEEAAEVAGRVSADLQIPP